MSENLQSRVVDALQPKPEWSKGNTLLWRPSPAAPFSFYVRFLGEYACKINVKGAHDALRAEAILRALSPDDCGSKCIAFKATAALEGTAFDHLAIVSPTLFNGALSKTTEFMSPVTYTVFPAYRCEFPADDTRDELAFRLAKVVSWSNWGRSPAPAINARYVRTKTGIKSTGGKRMGVFAWSDVERILSFIDKEAGFMELQNFERRQANFSCEGGRFTITADGTSWESDLAQAIGWLRDFVTKGGDGARREG